jgi:hypothetical protein
MENEECSSLLKNVCFKSESKSISIQFNKCGTISVKDGILTSKVRPSMARSISNAFHFTNRSRKAARSVAGFVRALKIGCKPTTPIVNTSG